MLLGQTRHLFKFRQADMIRMNDMPKSRPLEATTPMTTFSGHTKGSIASESKVSLNNFKKGSKLDGSAYPVFKNDLYNNTFQRSFLGIIKTEDFMMLTWTLILMMEITMTSNSLKKKCFAYSVLVTSLQTKRERTDEGV